MESIVQSIIQQQLESSEQFPVNFTIYSEWLGFSTKANAKKALLKSGFEEGVDYQITSNRVIQMDESLNHSTLSYQEQAALTKTEVITLTVECAKAFSMMARTEQGKLVRKWYLEVERQWRDGKAVIEQPKHLTSTERIDKVAQLKDCLEYFGMDVNNPRFQQPLQDLIGDTLGLSHNLLPASTPVYLGVAERAEQLGYQISLVTQHRSQLGKYVKSAGHTTIKEKRLCNGTMREINLYELTEQLDISIKEFMDAKTLSSYKP